MRSVTQLKSLGDLRTTISTHARSTPRNKGSSYLEVYLLDTERQRLQTELGMLAKRQRRIEVRLGEIEAAKERILNNAQRETSGSTDSTDRSQGHESRDRTDGKWRKLIIGY